MANIYVANRQIVKPGDLLAEGDDVIAGSYTYKVGSKVYGTVVGLAEVKENAVSIIPLEGIVVPREGDLVIGIVVGVGITNWFIDIRAPYKAVLNASEAVEQFNPLTDDIRKYLDVGDYILAKILIFDRSRGPVLTTKAKGLGKIVEGVVVDVKPSRVPRIVGKKKTMLEALTSSTNCNITVAVNGRIWIKCPNSLLEDIVIRAIRKIESEAHIPGLTDRIRKFIEDEKRRVGIR